MVFSDYFWLLLWTFLFFAYLMLLVNILIDLFRDSDTGGWGKAAWIVVLLVFPFLGALAYVIMRGSAMAERRNGSSRPGARDDAYVPTAPGVPAPAAQIASAKALLDAGAISQSEFETLKQRALA
ncbi:SHOCT domain-containing protein [Cellulomonas sp. PhB150]|uniref:SHOCT domain-containing protein n=1 Tax=Cellulomonas sp. PhB150 TaxID=2485188 RepID=UPI000F478B14|nr:SHOCT domain-containing protein [Cellulomonas sp. PhB150]ROS30949.1 putative oligomerization/nucleic acid binding protein [Cellulomonas sp. PhB150]